MIEVTVPGSPPGPNNRLGHMARARTAAKWRRAAREAALAVLPADWTPLTQAQIEVVMVVPDGRARDWDNAIAARKPLFDGLVDAGVLIDDSNRVLRRLSFGFAVRHGIASTVFRVSAFRTE